MNTYPLGAFDSLGRLNVVVELPRGGACRYRFTGRPGGFEVSGLQPRPTRRGSSRSKGWQPPPFDTGIIPGAWEVDGRPLETVLLDDAPASVGCIIPARLIGIILPQGHTEGHKTATGLLVAASALSARFSCIGRVEELSPAVKEAIVQFYRELRELKGEAYALGPVKAREVFLEALSREKRSVPEPTKVGVTTGALFKGGVHLKRHANALAGGA